MLDPWENFSSIIFHKMGFLCKQWLFRFASVPVCSLRSVLGHGHREILGLGGHYRCGVAGQHDYPKLMACVILSTSATRIVPSSSRSRFPQGKCRRLVGKVCDDLVRVPLTEMAAVGYAPNARVQKSTHQSSVWSAVKNYFNKLSKTVLATLPFPYRSIAPPFHPFGNVGARCLRSSRREPSAGKRHLTQSPSATRPKRTFPAHRPSPCNAGQTSSGCPAEPQKSQRDLWGGTATVRWDAPPQKCTNCCG